MELDSKQTPQPTEAATLKVQRSAAHPSITIEEAVTIVSAINKNFRDGFTKREDIIKIVEEITHPRLIAAATYYELLNRVKDTYQVSSLFKSIAFAINNEEKRKSLIYAFKAPKFNKELIKKFNGSEVPKELVVHLYRFHGITEEAAPLAASVFLQNAKYCKVLDDNNILNVDLPDMGESKDSNNDSQILDKSKPEEKQGENGGLKKIEHPTIEAEKPKGFIEEMVNSDERKIRLTGGRYALLKHPINLSTKDILIMKKEIEQLELLLE